MVADRGQFDALATPHKSFVPLCGYDTYQRLLGSCEISFMLLLDTPFNRCKSDLKFIEAAASRAVPLASETVYRDFIEDGRTGVLFRSPEDLEQRLLRLVANREVAQSIGDAARLVATRHRMLAYQVSRRAAWYHAVSAPPCRVAAGLGGAGAGIGVLIPRPDILPVLVTPAKPGLQTCRGGAPCAGARLAAVAGGPGRLLRTTRAPAEARRELERVTGIEPAPPAWKAGALPLSYTHAGPPMAFDGGGFLHPVEAIPGL